MTSASRMHAVIEVGSPEDITLIDLGNEPGTVVNGARVNKCKLHVGDQIQVGGTMIVLERADAAGAEVEAVPAAVVVAPPPRSTAARRPFGGAILFGGPNPFASGATSNPFAGGAADPFEVGVRRQSVCRRALSRRGEWRSSAGPTMRC